MPITDDDDLWEILPPEIPGGKMRLRPKWRPEPKPREPTMVLCPVCQATKPDTQFWHMTSWESRGQPERWGPICIPCFPQGNHRGAILDGASWGDHVLMTQFWMAIKLLDTEIVNVRRQRAA